MRPTALIRVLTHLIEIQRPAFIWGPPGVGKSDVVAQLAEAQERDLRDVRLNLMDPVDLKGFPVPNHDTRQMSWYAPDFLPPMYVRRRNALKWISDKPKKPTEAWLDEFIPNPSKGILFLDEMNSADRATQAAAYQLMLNRRIGDYKLPDGWAILAAGNRQGDRSVTNVMPAALANRLVHLDFDVNIDDFSAWAIKQKVKADLIGFLRFRTNLLYTHKPDELSARAFPSPRAWMFVNDIIGRGLPADDEFETLKGTVGEGAAGEFMSFIRVARSLPSVDDIMLNPAKAPVPHEPAALWAISSTLAERATKDAYSKLMIYVARMPKEFQVVFVRDSVKRRDEVSSTKAFTDWCIENNEVLSLA